MLRQLGTFRNAEHRASRHKGGDAKPALRGSHVRYSRSLDKEANQCFGKRIAVVFIDRRHRVLLRCGMVFAQMQDVFQIAFQFRRSIRRFQYVKLGDVCIPKSFLERFITIAEALHSKLKLFQKIIE